MEELDTAAVSYQIVLTKADKMKPGPLQRMVEETETAVARNPAANPRCLTTSSESGTGIAELRADRKSVVWGTSVSVCVDFGGRRSIKKKTRKRSKIYIIQSNNIN